ncbi:TonB-dependent receptor [Novosphingobium terrae]|uniref:TonB-dependent receptor n=1 Tax=Novosphingobium terrae TaxID=2726189 RepID=UPI0019804594|nr:TonB-dependent receptor [Novosphingobium terrae]
MRERVAGVSMRRLSGVSLATLLGGTMLASTPALAQQAANPDTPADIVVTAQKREESLQQVPISIQALSAAKMEQHQVASFDDYAKLLPSVSFQSYGPGQSQIYFRGVTSGSDYNGAFGGSQPTSALYLDEMPLTTIGGAVDLHIYDMQRVEALSGPQGTLFGSSSLSGTLRLITNKPTHKFEAGIDVSGTTFGKGSNSSGGSIDAFINIPISQSVALRASGFYQRDGGYISNVPGTRNYPALDVNGNPTIVPVSNAKYVKKNYNDVETWGGRAALGIDLDENWTVTPSVIYQDQRSHGTFLYGPLTGNDPLSPSVGDLKVQDYTPEMNRDQWVQAAMTIHGKLGNWDVTYAGGYFSRFVDTTADYSDYTVSYYESLGPAYTSFIGANGQNLDPSQIYHVHHHYTKQSHEFRVSSPSTDRFRLTAGLFMQRQSDEVKADYIIPGLATAQGNPAVPRCGDDIFCSRINRIDRDYAAFADASYDILPNLTLSAGIRGFIANNTAAGFSGTASRVGTAACPVTSDMNLPCLLYSKKAVEAGQTHRVTLNWKVDRDHLVYATYSTGYRPGGINRLVQVAPYEADTLTNYEVGVKTSWFNRHLTVNLALFDEEWNKMQIGLTTPDSNGTLSIYNVGSARIRGLEGDASLNLGHFTLSGSGAYTDAKTRKDFCNIGASGNPDCSQGVYIPAGTRLPVQPKFKGNVTARYSFDLGGYRPYVQASASHQSGTDAYFVQPVAGALWQTAGFTTFDFALGAKAGQWSWEAFVLNAFDKRGILSLNTVCIPSTCAQFARAYATRPQEFGIKLGRKF